LLLQLSIHITVKKKWVKGHYTGPRRTLKHNLNDIADDLAGSGNNPPILHPFYEAELVHNNLIVTSKLQQIVTAAIHTATLQQYTTKSAGWHQSILVKINWDAHKRAFCLYSHTQCIGVTKLALGLYHTNQKANIQYCTSDLCPCCNSASETLEHVFTCPSTHVSDNRCALCTQLQESLNK
jgi:hypothetical protein